ncbi:mannosyltransferase [Galbibacter sp. PAP.153]|uniref:mannosyltransferase n=1 Tax=Galbibacter sp. PAP.153 TaxID=3104623 RepID=UPI00300BDDCE
MIPYWKTHKYPLLFVLSSLLFYTSFAYDLERTDTVKLMGIYVALFYFYYKTIQFEKGNFNFLLVFGMLSRIVFIVAVPNLSQDFYRFLWDGKLIADGINPFIHTPLQLMQDGNFNAGDYRELLQGMGNLSAGHYSNYPPVNQLFFFLGNFFGKTNILGSIIFIRICIILADIGILYFGKKILTHLNFPKHQIFWYFLNPFIIIELTGNLHFEGIMLFFFVVALYFIIQKKWVAGALFMGVSISVKLLPLVFLPFFIRWFKSENNFNAKNISRLLLFYAVVFITFLATFIPFVSSELMSRYVETIGLWFNKFEFNASFYYLVREIGFYMKGYNIIETAGTRMAFIVFLFILGLAFIRKNHQLKTFMVSLLMAISFYYSMSTTVHPWYIATPVLLCIFTTYKFPIVWSLVVILSYQAYANANYQENLWLIAVEYCILYGCFLKEVYLGKPILKHL